jgi:ethanolamine utilization protein EutQ (cupin superfamily)
VQLATRDLPRVAKAPTSEPWLTLHYDEWICVVKGRVLFEVDGGSSVAAEAGQTVFISKGSRFRPSFPVADTQCASFHP